jgi:hypothetical protein
MKLTIASAIAALTLATAPVAAQDYLKPQAGYSAPSQEMEVGVDPSGIVWQASQVMIPDFALPEGTELGDEVPIEIVGLVKVLQGTNYLPVPVLFIEIKDIQFVGDAEAGS